MQDRSTLKFISIREQFAEIFFTKAGSSEILAEFRSQFQFTN